MLQPDGPPILYEHPVYGARLRAAMEKAARRRSARAAPRERAPPRAGEDLLLAPFGAHDEAAAADDGDGDDCAVCARALHNDDGKLLVLRRLPCGHVFHRECVNAWLARRAVCPLCRAALPARPEYPCACCGRPMREDGTCERAAAAAAPPDAEQRALVVAAPRASTPTTAPPSRPFQSALAQPGSPARALPAIARRAAPPPARPATSAADPRATSQSLSVSRSSAVLQLLERTQPS